MIGTTTTAGGHFDYVTITGECRVNGSVECGKLSLTGELGIAGDLKVKEMKITGQCQVDGRIDGLSIRGHGEISVSSGLKMEQVSFNGSLTVNGSCEAERLNISGAVNIGELLSADRLEIGLYGPSRAREVGGGTIDVKRSTASRIRKLVNPKQEASFEAELIEGDTIRLTDTRADTVRGNHIIIGPGCEINIAQFRSSLEIHKSARVNQQMKM